MRPHRRQLAACVGASKEAVVGGKSLGRVPITIRGHASLGERFRRFRRSIAARRNERVSVSDLQAPTPGTGEVLRRPSARLVRHRDRLAEMRDRLLKGGAPQSLVARLAPPLDREVTEAGLGEVMGDRLWLGAAVA